MPEDLRKQIIEAIAASADANQKFILMLLLRVEEIFIGSVNELKDQMNVPAEVHEADHDWIKSHRDTESGVKSVVMKVSISLVEKGSLVGAGALAAKFFGG